MSDLILALDGSTYTASVALLRGGRLLAEGQTEGASGGDRGDRGGRGETLVPLISELLSKNGATAAQVTRVICGAGPGSFTSLRIAASVAKGIAVAAGAKLYSVSSLLLTVAGLPKTPADGSYFSVLPAMRGEWFALPVSVSGDSISATAPTTIVAEAELGRLARKSSARVVGPGREIDAAPHARGVLRLLQSINAAGAVNLASWEPNYGRLSEAQVKWEAAHGRPLRP